MGWIDALPPVRADDTVDWGVAIYMASYIVITNWTLLQALWKGPRRAECTGGLCRPCLAHTFVQPPAIISGGTLLLRCY